MKKFVMLILILMAGINVYGAEYNFLVFPTSFVTNENMELININTEELLAKKIINQIVMTNLAITPSIKTVKEKIKTQGKDFDSNSLMDLFNVQNALVITSKVEIQNPVDERKMWGNLDIPIITNNNNTLKITTNVKLISSDKEIWRNTFYKNINLSENDINYYSKHLSKTEIFNQYYEKVAKSVIKDIKKFDKTIFETKNSANLSPSQINIKEKQSETENKEITNQPVPEQKESAQEKNTESENKKIPLINFDTNIKPNFEVNENVKQQTKPKFTDKLKNTVKLKDDAVKQEIEENNIRNKNPEMKNVYTVPSSATVKDLTPIQEKTEEPAKQQKWTDKIREKYNNFVKKLKK